MKDSSIRIRISGLEKTRIEDFAQRIGRPVSEVLRRAAADAIRGEVPGTRQRQVCVDVRRTANRLLATIDMSPINIDRLRVASEALRSYAQELITCK